MTIVINTTTLVVGGALQVALSFLNELKKFGKDEYHVFLSSQVERQLDCSTFPENFRFYSFAQSPASLRHRWSVVRRLKQLEAQIAPEVVFTVFGPSYWRPKAKHLLGFALPQIVYADEEYMRSLSVVQRWKYLSYKKRKFRSCADRYVTESEDVSRRLEKCFKLPLDSVFTVGNTCGAHFFDANAQEVLTLPHSLPDVFKLIVISANHSHKNLSLIPEVCSSLLRNGVRCMFYVTLAPDDYESIMGDHREMIYNLGPVDVKYCPSLYQQADALFLPTRLECFTASYPEAMAMRKPIITSDLGFARSICANAAEYFDPTSAQDAVRAIQLIMTNEPRRDFLVSEGSKRLRGFPSALKRAEEYVEILHSLVKEKI